VSFIVDMADRVSRDKRSFSFEGGFEVNGHESGQEVKRWRRVNFIYPAVGRLIFASYLEVSLQTCSHLFDSPRPFLSLGSGVVLRRGVP
jgi:hypothetical protein